MSRFANGRRWSTSFGLLLLGLTGACSDDDALSIGPDADASLPEEVRTGPAPRLSSQGIAPALQPCGSSASYTLRAGAHFPGKVIVSNDAENLYVAYVINDATEADQKAGWYISDTRLAVARTTATIPKDGSGQPNPWSFPHSGEHEPVVKSFTYIIPFSQYNLKVGEKIIIAAMAGVVHPKDVNNWSGTWEWLVGWGVASQTGSTMKDLPRYTLQGCGETPPPAPSTKGAITITFDDGWMDTYTNAYPVLKEFGIKANVAVNPTSVDQQWTTYMHLPQIQALHNDGWTIVSHTLTHPDLKTVSSTELHRQLRDSQAWVRDKGYRGAHILVVPFHSWSDREKQAIMQYYKGARGYSVNQFSPGLMQPYPVPQSKYFEITGFEPEYAPFTTVAGREQTRDYLERAVAEGEVVDIFFHHITDEQVPAFRELVKILNEYKANIVTYDKIIPA